MRTFGTATVGILVAGSLLLGTAAHADTFEGTIDGEPRQWHILEYEGESTASFSEDFGMLDVSLQGHAEQRFTTQGTLSINFTLMDSQLIDEPEVMYLPESSMFPNYMAVEGSGQLTLDHYTVDGDTARFSGRYEGELMRYESMRDEPNADDTISVDVRFDIEASRESF